MLNQKDIVCISYTTWYGPYTKSTVQLLSRLAKNNRVIFVEYPFTIKDIFTTLLGKKNAPVTRMLGLKKRLKTLHSDVNSKVYQLVLPPMFPVDFIKNEILFKPFYLWNSFIYRTTLNHTLKKLNYKNTVAITAWNALYGLPLLRRLNEKIHIYYCYDGIETRRHGKRIFKIDENFSKNVDGIVTTSDYLNIDKKRMNTNSFIVKNGVDYEIFAEYAKSDILEENKRKRIGYIGSLDHRFDIDTIEYCISKLPDVDFEFTGDLRNTLIKQRLQQFENVKFFAPVPPNDVPKILSSYDLGIIPYIVNEVNKNIYPLKINEYLAVGVPVVLTSFANIPEFKQIVQFATDKNDFLNKVKDELDSDSQQKIEARKKFSKKNSWNNKTIEFENIIEYLLEQKTN